MFTKFFCHTTTLLAGKEPFLHSLVSNWLGMWREIRWSVTRRSKADEQLNVSMKRTINAALMLFLVFFDLCMLSFRSHHPQ